MARSQLLLTVPDCGWYLVDVGRLESLQCALIGDEVMEVPVGMRRRQRLFHVLYTRSEAGAVAAPLPTVFILDDLVLFKEAVCLHAKEATLDVGSIQERLCKVISPFVSRPAGMFLCPPQFNVRIIGTRLFFPSFVYFFKAVSLL